MWCHVVCVWNGDVLNCTSSLKPGVYRDMWLFIRGFNKYADKVDGLKYRCWVFVRLDGWRIVCVLCVVCVP